MSNRLKSILVYGVAAPLFFLFSVVAGAYLTFPYDHLRDFIVQEAERGGTIHLEIESLEPSWVTGVELENLTLSNVPEGDEEPTTTTIPHAEARVSLLALMGGTTEVSFETQLAGNGSIVGELAQDDESMHIEATLDNVHLAGLPIASTIGVPIAGRADGEIDLTIGAEAVNTEGTVHLTIENLAIADGQTPIEIEGLGAGLTLERMDLGTLTFDLDTERGTGSIEELHASGEHAELWGTGSIRLARDFDRSSVDLMFRIAFLDAYKTSSPRMEGLFALLEVNPQVRPARTPNGAFQWRVTGSMGGRIRMVPSGNAPMPEAD